MYNLSPNIPKQIISSLKYISIYKMECQHCHKTFSTKSNLTTHQTTAKYCLAKQGKESNNFTCNDCGRSFTANKILTDHVHVCKERLRKEREEKDNDYVKMIRKLESENSKLKKHKLPQHHVDQITEKDRIINEKTEYISKLEEQLREKDRIILSKDQIISEIALQPRGTTHTHTDNRVQTILTGHFDMSNVSRVSDVLDEFLDKDVVAMGQKGLGEMIATRLLRDEEGKQLYVCTDLSRHHFKFVNTEGLTETDPKAYRLIGLIQEAGLSSKTAEVMQAIYDEFDHSDADSPEVYSQSILELMTLKRDSSKFRSVLASVTAKGST